jgi:hypothetical protein
MRFIVIAALVLAGCAIHDKFAFTLSDGTVATSSDTASGSVNNAGFLTLSDDAWSLTMDLQGLAPGDHAITNGAGELQISETSSGQTYMTSLGGSCSVWLDAHGASNGSPVTGHFTCTGLTSTKGTTVDVSEATFEVPISDPANNPLHH